MSSLNAPVVLRAEHDLTGFDCGKPPLDEFLQRHALEKQRAMLSRTYVVTIGEAGQVVAYYTLAHISIVQDEAPKKMGRGMPSSIPAILMARFAVDRRFQGHGLGRSLFTDAVRRTWAVMEKGPAPVRVFVVDAKDDEAARFYARFDMLPSPHNPMRLFLSYKTLQGLFGE
jgi:GNAT superfamily N-acetyltransferase